MTIMKIAASYLASILCNFKFYRKKKGGSWYHVMDIDDAGGPTGSGYYWTQDPGDLPYRRDEHY